MKVTYLAAVLGLAVGGAMSTASTPVAAFDFGDGSGCSAISGADITGLEGDSFEGTMGLKALTSEADADGDGLPDSVENCICDALDPGDGTVCDSEDPEQRDQFVGDLEVLERIKGQKYGFAVTGLGLDTE